MPVAWFFVPYKRRDTVPGRPGRYCGMDDFTAQMGWACPRHEPDDQGGLKWL
jgi:hypothetical protein